MISKLSLSLLALVAATAASAQAPPLPPIAHDYKQAPAGTYALDPKHTGLIARVPHFGFSYSVERFTDTQSSLTWDPANPGADKLTASVDPKSIVPIPITGRDFSADLSGDKFLNAAKYPTATFTGAAFHPTGPDRGTVGGDMTIMGVTKPVTWDVTLVGTGKGFRGPVIGVHAVTHVDPRDYGLPNIITGPVELTLDAEFDKQG
jgi:polyisoprenoid-binding protein YceI